MVSPQTLVTRCGIVLREKLRKNKSELQDVQQGWCLQEPNLISPSKHDLITERQSFCLSLPCRSLWSSIWYKHRWSVAPITKILEVLCVGSNTAWRCDIMSAWHSSGQPRHWWTWVLHLWGHSINIPGWCLLLIPAWTVPYLISRVFPTEAIFYRSNHLVSFIFPQRWF